MFWYKPNTEWDFTHTLFQKKLIDGTYHVGLMMRRRVHGEWQYRRMTEAEKLDFEVHDAR